MLGIFPSASVAKGSGMNLPDLRARVSAAQSGTSYENNTYLNEKVRTAPATIGLKSEISSMMMKRIAGSRWKHASVGGVVSGSGMRYARSAVKGQ